MSKKIAKFLLNMAILLGLFTFVMLLECLVFQFPAIRYKQKPLTISLSEEDLIHEQSLVELTEDEIRSIKVQRENEKMLAEYRGEVYEVPEDETLVEENNTMYRKVNKIHMNQSLEQPYYVHQIDVRIPVEDSTGYRVQFSLNGQISGKNLYCSIEPKIAAGIVNANVRADAYDMEIVTSEEINAEDIQITLSNSFEPNVMRILFMLMVGVIVWILFTVGAKAFWRPQWLFAVICFMLGSLLIWGIGTNQLGYDEYVHAKAAYKMSFGSTIESTESAIQMCGNLLPFFKNPKERVLIEAYEDVNNDFSWADIGHQSRIKRAENRVYYPMAVGFYLGRKLNLSFAWTVMFAKFGNLLFYIFVVFWAIKLAERYQYLVALIGLLPNCIFLASSISYDAIVNSFLLLGSVLVLNECLRPEQKLDWKNAVLILLCFFVGSISKPIYIVMVLMMLFFGKQKFHSKWQYGIFCVSILAVAGLMMYNIFKPTPSTGSDYYLVGNFSYAGDKRNVGTSVIGQVQYVLGNPLTFALLLLRSMWEMFFGYFFSSDRFLQYGYAGAAHGFFMYLIIALAIWVSLFNRKDGQRRFIGAKYIVLNQIMIFGVSTLIWASMYASYTSVGADEILGVQGRYFIPLFLPFFACLMNSKIKSRFTDKTRARVVFGVMAGVNLYMIWTLIVTAMNV